MERDRGKPGAAARVAAVVTAIAAVALLVACGTDDGGPPAGDTRTAPNGDVFNDVDVDFAAGMIQHHAQALVMVDLTMGRPLDPQIRQVAEDVREAQGLEIETMVMARTEQQDGAFGPAVELATESEARQEQQIEAMRAMLDS